MEVISPEAETLEFAGLFPVWNDIAPEWQRKISESLSLISAEKGTVLHSGSEDCTGLLLVRSGRLRAYILSDEGREITIYRLFERDICLFSAQCIIRSAQFDITVEAEADSEIWRIPAPLYSALMSESAAVANYTNEVMASRFSEVMWLMEQILWKSFDRRLAGFLLEESAVEGTESLRITHETIASHLGSAREVITRMLRYFQQEGMVRLGRGCIEIMDSERLAALSEK